MSESSKWDNANTIGLYLGLVGFAVLGFFAIMADADRRADARSSRDQLDVALKKSIGEQKTRAIAIHEDMKKTREMLFKAYLQHEKRLDAIEKAIADVAKKKME